MKKTKDFSPGKEWKHLIPRPVCDGHKDFIALYHKAWELAHDHIKELPGLPFSPYMDEGALPYDIWIWDTCFMALFCKYSQNVFPGVESLQNFYQVLHQW